MTKLEEVQKQIEQAVWNIGDGPTLAAFGHAREDCALAHIDYFAGVSIGRSILFEIVGNITGETNAEVRDRLKVEDRPCDCSSCIGAEASKKREEEIRAGYTLVEKFKTESAA